MARGGIDIRVDGLDEAIKALGDIDRELPREVRRGIKEDARPILDDAKRYAHGIADTGAYASSLAMRAISGGVRIQSDDPGAGVIEFARPGAFYLTGPRAGRRIGVPAGGPPRALVKASEENEDVVVRDVEDRIAALIDRYLRG